MRSWRFLKRSRIVFICAISVVLSLIIMVYSVEEFSGLRNNIVRRETVKQNDVKLRNVENLLKGKGMSDDEDSVNSLFHYDQVKWEDKETSDYGSKRLLNNLVTLTRLNYKSQFGQMERSLSNVSTNFGTTKNQEGTKRIESVQAHKVLQEFEGIHEVPLIDITQAKVPNTVYYVWCPNRTLEFRQFLGILSIWKIMRPNIIEFRHQYPLVRDDYNNWVEELKEMIPEFVTVQFTSIHDKGDENNCAFWMGLAHVREKGGIFIASDVIVTKEILQYMGNPFSVIYRTRHNKSLPDAAIVMGNANEETLVNFRKTYYDGRTKTGRETMCSEIDNNYEFARLGPCYIIKNAFIHPEDIWTLSTDFGEFARKIVYGSSDMINPKPVLPGSIPKVVHYVWFGRKEMTFIMYLSMLSTLFIANPEMVYIHGDGGLYGPYFERIAAEPRVVIIKHQQPYYIYGNLIIHKQHLSDILRADILLKYGGIYIDWDVVWLRDPEDIINAGYDAVANFDHMPKPNFPNTINLGVFMAKPRSVVVKRWQDAFKAYRSKDFLYNAVLIPYKIYEKYPQHLYIEKRLQVMCYYLKCHPVFHPDFKNYMKEQPFDWRTDVYSIHFTWPDPQQWSSEEMCRNGTGRFAEIGNYILQYQDKLANTH